MKCAFPYYGSKTKIAPMVWDYFGELKTYIEPFCGSAAMLFGRPDISGREIINDMNGFIVNFFRAVKADPDAVAQEANFPVNECELHARHMWLLEQNIDDKLYNDPDFFDVKVAGRWLYGARIWIGAGWCRHKNLEHRPDIQHENKWPNIEDGNNCPNQTPMLQDGNTALQRCDCPLNTVCDLDIIKAHMKAVSERLKFVKVVCGDWKRVVTPTVLNPAVPRHKIGVFFDPPYAHGKRMKNIYRNDSLTIAKDVEKWCRKAHPNIKICLAGYEGDYDLPGWKCIAWKSTSNHSNSYKERLWFQE
jgi:DNA adenine methylase